MLLVKTPLGLEALKSRQGALSMRQRSAFILFDGRRTVQDVLAATAGMGITRDDVHAMVSMGLLAEQGKPMAVSLVDYVATPSDVDHNAMDLGTVELVGPDEPGRSPQQRYQVAYPIATALTAKLGLRGFQLNLAVERVGSYQDLVALAPKIQKAVGDAQFAPLSRALFDD